jgi:hypothetical protein
MTLSLLRGRLCCRKQDVNAHCQKRQLEPTLSAVDLPKAFDRSNAPIYGLDCRALALFVLTVSIDV